MIVSEIKILGAGVSGLTAAINLAKSGHDVSVYDRAPDCGRRFMGDLQGLENWTHEEDVLQEIKSMNIKPSFYKNAFRKITMTNLEETMELRFKKPIFYLVKRGAIKDSMDQSLKRQALDAGAELHFNARMRESDADIITTGPKPETYWAIDKGIVFETEMEDMSVTIVNNDVAYNGYSYFLVSGGYGCMCTVVFHDFARLDKCWNATRKVFWRMLEPDIRNEHGCGGVGSFMLEKNLFDGHSLRAGEAAGLQDFLWGFGIRNAMVSGYLAAMSIENGDDYGRLVDKRLTDQMKASVVNRYIWESIGKNNYRYFLKQLKNAKDPWKLLHGLHKFDMQHKLLYPIALRHFKKCARR